LWQSLDHGASWIEVGSPLLGRTQGGLAINACSAVGCDLGSWYRIGWPASTPVAEAPLVTVSAPPRVGRPPLRQLVCKAASEAHSFSLPRGDSSPADFGIGAMRLPTNDSGNLVRTLFDRHGVNPAHASSVSQSSDDYAAPRLLLYGGAVNPEQNVLAARRQVV